MVSPPASEVTERSEFAHTTGELASEMILSEATQVAKRNYRYSEW